MLPITSLLKSPFICCCNSAHIIIYTSIRLLLFIKIQICFQILANIIYFINSLDVKFVSFFPFDNWLKCFEFKKNVLSRSLCIAFSLIFFASIRIFLARRCNLLEFLPVLKASQIYNH